MTTTQTESKIHRGDERGTTSVGWLHARHSFSFGRFHDPDRMAFRSLRVLNDDVIAGGGGFGQHPHDNMEIISWMLKGALAHQDVSGGRGVIRPGDVQVMTAGRGIQHSEMNASETDPANLIQIWIEPAERDLEPAYAQRSFPKKDRRNQWQVVVSADGREDSLVIHQDAILSIAELEEGRRLDLALNTDRHGYLHLAYGAVRMGDHTLRTGDSITWAGARELVVEALQESQLLFFDLA
jgi:hypothetical protein